MARVGLKGFWTATYAIDSNNNISYTNYQKVSRGIQVDKAISTNRVRLYSDDSVEDEVNAVNSVTLTVTPNEWGKTVQQALCGITTQTLNINGTDVQLTGASMEAEGTPVGFAYLETVRVEGVTNYRATVYFKVKFAPTENESISTKGENISFLTPSYAGEVFAPFGGAIYYAVDDFATEAAAVQFIESILKP